MKKTLILVFVSICFTTVFGQSQGTILSIDDQEISSDEFLRVYNKNNNLTSSTDQKSVDEYMDLFINYKLKVIEAEDLGYDTIQSFIDEFTGYEKQLAKPYLEDSKLKEGLVEEAYERYSQEVKASHILIKCPAKALPKDTLKAYHKIKAIRARIIGGEPFEQVAKATSDDPSVKNNSGDLGYFSAFRMVYPFECAAFNTPVGEVSNIFRTSYGYHILKVYDKRPNRGSVKAAHIATSIAKNATEPEIRAAEEKINKAYTALMNGMSWNDAVKEFSENPRTKANNGEIGWLSAGQAPAEFFDPIIKLDINEFTKPVRTQGGFHIGYVLDKKPIESFDEAKEKMARQVDRDVARKAALKEQQKAALKKKYKAKEYKENIMPITATLDSTIYTNNWNPENAAQLTKPVLVIDQTTFTQYDYAKYLASNDVLKGKKSEFDGIVAFNYDNYVEKMLTDYAMEKLPKENPDYRYLLNEYHDGILLFNLTNDKVWQKAQEDTLGLEAFYKNAEKYQWNERIVVNIYKYKDNSFTTKLPSLIKKQIKKKKDDTFLSDALCPDDSLGCITISTKTYEKGQDAMADKLTWTKGEYITESDKDYNYIYYVVKTIDKTDKTLDEAKGMYIADYQSYLENNWVTELKEKHDIQINQAELDKVKSELNQQ